MRKKCSSCRREKNLSEFYPDNAGVGYRLGYSAWCRECHKANRRARYAASKESRTSDKSVRVSSAQ